MHLRNDIINVLTFCAKFPEMDIFDVEFSVFRNHQQLEGP